MVTPESRFFRIRSLRCTGVWPSLSLQRPLVGGCRGGVPSVDVGRGMGCAQGRVSPVRQRMVKLCLLCDRAERLHGGGTQVGVAIMMGEYELGVAGTWRRVLQDGVLRRRPPPVHLQH